MEGCALAEIAVAPEITQGRDPDRTEEGRQLENDGYTTRLRRGSSGFSRLMMPAQQKLEKDLAATTFGELRVPLVTNVDADTIRDGEEARSALLRQVSMPVRWEESMRLLLDEGVNTFVEVGPGRVLTGLMRQIERSVATLNVEDEKSLQATIDKIAAARSDAA